jgi:LmbE family N-acetylglucosaminyl deacetylase
MAKVMVIAPHPDDETLGCGGTLLKHLDNGDELSWLIVTSVPENSFWSAEKIQRRKEEIELVKAKYGFKNTYQLNLPSSNLDTLPMGEIVSAFSKTLVEEQPETLYVPHYGDVHSDHRVVFDSVMSASKNFRVPSVKFIYTYETLSETEFNLYPGQRQFLPNTYVDISKYFADKINIMEIYKSEIMDAPYPRSLSSITSLARYRGSRIGCEYAESFCLLLGVH